MARRALALVRLPEHANVVLYHDAFVEQSLHRRLVIVMELAEHGSVRDCAATLALGQVLDIGIQLARGLAHAHHHGVVHQDVSPANALLFPLTPFG